MKALLIAFFAASSVFAAQHPLHLTWTNNLLRITGPNMPGGYIEVWYLEAFCRSGSTHRKWDQTTIPHKTELTDPRPHHLQFRTRVEPSVVVDHVLKTKVDEVEIEMTIRNESTEFVDVQWFQPCVRLARFTGRNQTNYIEKSFIFTSDTTNGLKLLSELPRTEEAIYRGGQVYVPEGIPMEDVNPRPISTIKPSNNLIGAFSADGKKIFATAWDQTQELFQGVAVCLHNDPRIGGLKPNETRKLKGKIYILDNDPEALLKRYKADFGR
jgi:hypothetical protein